MRRQAWFEAQPDLDPEHLVFIDETGASTKMARLRGRAKRGQRCRSLIPHGHWKTTTFTGALRLEGMTAPMVLDGPMTSVAFLAYVEQVLVPGARQSAPPSTRLAPGCSTCRPTRPTSTRFEVLPRTDAFAKLKAILRKAAARTIDGLWEAIRDTLPRSTLDECRNYFTAAGYEPD